MEGTKRLILWLLLGLYAFTARAVTYYVDGDFGDDAWNGRFDAYSSGSNGPKKTIAAALSIASDLDVIQITGGVYNECLTINKTLNFAIAGNISVRCLVMNGVNKRLILGGSELIVTDTLRLTRGTIDASIANLVAAANCRLVGGSNLSFVEGKLFRVNTNTTVSNLFFPIGTGLDYRPVWISFNQSTSAQNRYVAQVSLAALAPSGLPVGIKNISKVHFWNLRHTGTAVPSAIAIRLQYDTARNDDEVFDPQRLRLVIKYPGSPVFRNLGGTGTARFRGTIAAAATTDTLGNFTLANAMLGTNTLGRREPTPKFVWTGNCEGAPIQFTDSSYSHKSTITRWRWDFGTGNPADTSVQRNPRFTFSGTGPFMVSLTVTNNLGLFDSVVRIVFLRPKPVAVLSASDACFGNTQTFADLSTAALPDTIKSRVWFLGDGNTRINKVVNHRFAAPGIYNLRLAVVSTSNCTDTAKKTINVFSRPSPVINIQKICLGDTTVFRGSGGVPGDSIVSWNWSIGASSVANTRSFTNKFAAEGSYQVQLAVVSQNNCRDTARQSQTIYKGPAARFGLDPGIAGNDSIQCFRSNRFTLKSASSAGQGQIITENWYWDNSVVPGTNQNSKGSGGQLAAKLVVTTDRGCKDSAFANYVVRDPIVVKFGVAAFCLPRPADFSDSSSAGTASIVNRKWDFGDGGKANGTAVSYGFTIGGSYNVKLVISTDQGCADSITRPVVMTSTPLLTLVSTGRSPVCFGDSIRLRANGGFEVRWFDGDTNRTRYFKQSGWKKVTAFNSPFCFVSDSFRVDVHTPVFAEAGKDTSLVRGRYIILRGDGGVKYAWSPRGLCDDPDSVRTRVRPQVTTLFYLDVEDINGCTGRDSVRVSVTEPLFIRIPNMITPNGDGKNDAWDLREVPFVETGRITIFNHLGELVYEQNTGYNHTWNGTGNNGQPLRAGTYLYVIEVPAEKEPFKGYLQIMP